MRTSASDGAIETDAWPSVWVETTTMRPIPLVALGCATLTFAASIGWAVLGDAPRRAPAADEAPSRIASADRGRRRAQTDRRTRADDDGRATIELPVAEPAIVDESIDPAQRVIEREAQIDAHEATLLARIADEPADGSWSGPTEDAVRDALRGPEFAGARLVDVDCRTSLCRAELAASDDEAHERAASSLPLTPPFATNGLIRRTGDPDAPTLVVYFARPGHKI
jgi:hypothetical protein